MKKKYKEIEYWNTRHDPSLCTKEITRDHVDFIRDEVRDCETVLDFGPGTGRTFSAYKGKRVIGYDISSLYKNELIKKAKSCNINFMLVIADEIKRLPFTDKRFDVAVACEVLLHQRPENILMIMRGLARVAHKVVAVSWMKEPYDEVGLSSYPRHRHVFSYDYPMICQEQGWRIVIRPYNDQVFFVYSAGLGG